MPKYRYRTKLSASGYQSDGGTQYEEESSLGTGLNARARKFTAKTINKSIAVLNPMKRGDIDFEEATNKFKFFQAIYPLENVLFLKKRTSYRLILPLIPGTLYQKVKSRDVKTAELFLSAVLALQECHNKGYVILDLKNDNILYDKTSGKSFLIDGGMASKINEPVNALLQRIDLNDLISTQKNCTHIAPESWSTNNTAAIAHTSMDVYSLGVMFYFRRNIGQDVRVLVNRCLNMNPAERPTLQELEKNLRIILSESYQRAIRVITSCGIALNNGMIDKLQNNPRLIKVINYLNDSCNYLKQEQVCPERVDSYQASTIFLAFDDPTRFKNEYLKLKAQISIVDEAEFFNLANTVGNLMVKALPGAIPKHYVLFQSYLQKANSASSEQTSLFQYNPEDVVLGNTSTNPSF